MLTRGSAFSLSRIRVSADAMEMEMAMTADGAAAAVFQRGLLFQRGGSGADGAACSGSQVRICWWWCAELRWRRERCRCGGTCLVQVVCDVSTAG